MLIISKFKDYYDHGVAFGVDKKVVYTRHTEKVEYREVRPFMKDVLSKCPKHLYQSNSRNSLDKVPQIFVVGFCGNIYVGMVMYLRKNSGVIGYLPEYVPTYCYSEEDVAEFYAKHHPGVTPPNFEKRRFRDATCYTSYPYQKPFDTLGCPAFVYADGDLLTNPKLSDYRFHRKVAPMDAFQELSMYLPGVLLNTEDPAGAPLTDAGKALSKGFDKHSFRKRK